jgi:hypothetical protein
MTTWLELHQEMARHKKTLTLARLLKVDRRYAVGLMVDLWSWGLDNADADGSLNGLTADDIAMALDWPMKKADALISAFQQAGWLDNHDGTYALHDWSDYTGKLSEQREIQKEQNRIRQQRRREKLSSKKVTPKKQASNADVTRDITRDKRDCNEHTVPNPTVPNHTLSKLSDNNTPSASTAEGVTPDAGAGKDFGRVCQAFEDTVNPMPSSKDGMILSELYRDYPVQRVLDAIDETARCQGRSAAYVRSVLQNEDRKAKAPPNTGPDLTDPNRYRNFGK